MQQQELVEYHIGKITKKYIIDFLNALIFSRTVLWDGTDQYNELPVFRSAQTDGERTEQRGAIFVDNKTTRALLLSVCTNVTTIQRVCYRMQSLKEPLRINEEKRLYYPLDNMVLDLSVADLHLGSKDPASYSFADNTHNTSEVHLKRLFAILNYLLSARFIAIDDENIFHELLDHPLSTPPMPSDEHFNPVYGVDDAPGDYRD